MINFLNSSLLLIILFIIFLLPGLLISDLLIGKIKDFRNIISILFGFTFFLVVTIFFYLFEWRLDYLNIFIFITTLLSVITLILRKQLSAEIINLLDSDNEQKIVFILFLSAFFIQSNILMVNFENLGSDIWYYAAQSNYYVDSGILSMKYPYFDAPNSMYPLSFLFSLVALLELNIGWPAIVIINHLGSVFIISVSYLNYKLLNIFFSNRIICALSIFFLFIPTYIFNDGEFYNLLVHPFYPKNISVYLFFPIFMYLLINRKTLGNKFLIIISALAISFVNFHTQNTLWIAIYLSAYFLVEIVKHRKLKADSLYLLIVVTSIISFNLILIFNNLYSDTATFNQYSFEDNEGVLLHIFDITIVNPNIFISNRGINIGWNGFALIAMIGLIIKNRDYFLLYCGALLICIFFVILNPFFVSILLKIMPYFIFERFMILFPFAIISSYLIAITMKYFFEKWIKFSYIIKNYNQLNNLHVKQSVIGAIFVLMIFFISIDKIGSKNNIDSDNFYNFIRSDIELNSFVLADGLTAYTLPAYKKIKVPYIAEDFLISHIDFNDINKMTLLFDNKINLSKKLSIINSYDFKYIIVNKRLSNNNFLRAGVEGYAEIFDNSLFKVLVKKINP